MSWLIYFKAIIELVLILVILGVFIIVSFKSNVKPPLSQIITLCSLAILLLLSAIFLRGTIFKMTEGLDNVEDQTSTESKTLENIKILDNDFTKRTDDDYNNLSKGFIGENILRIKEINGVENISGKAFKDIFDSLYPIGTILIMDKNPKELLKFGEWELLNKYKNFDDLRFLSLVSPGNKDIQELGGFANVNLNQTNIPFHDHSIFTEQTTDKRDKHKVFKYENPNIKLQLSSIYKGESDKIGTNCTDPDCIKSKQSLADNQFKALDKNGYFMESKGHNNISPFIAVKVWVRNK